MEVFIALYLLICLPILQSHIHECQQNIIKLLLEHSKIYCNIDSETDSL